MRFADFKAVDWNALSATIPAMFALTFFGILHVPINVPALAIAAEEDDLNLNRELVAHGISNAASGFLGSIQVRVCAYHEFVQSLIERRITSCM